MISKLEKFLNKLPTRFELYLVGGAVRDIVMGNDNINDLDCLLISDNFQEFINYLENELNTTVVKDGIQFFHIKFFFDGIEIEVSIPRKEAYRNDSRKPMVQSGSLLDEVNRRDFTMNALLLDLRKYFSGNSFYDSIIDITNGIDDINNGIIRTNSSNTRFEI